ncbi:MAG TPA: hypothetical protein PLP17_04100, partial [Oligoflexia bacterium]|nr:hypothetical protein [Oligoflexia bacterium]
MPSLVRTCALSGNAFEVTTDDQEFYRSSGAVIDGVLYPLPAPTLSPRERLRRRLALRNERNLYKTRCCVSGRALVSVFSPDKPIKVVDCALWREQDNLQFGRPFDFSRPFFQQFDELYRDTYKPHVIHTGETVNSEYCHFAGWVKNCYLVFDIGYSEDCLYCVDIGRSRNCVDCFIALHSELCYEGVKLLNCYNVFFGTRCRSTSFSAFVEDCIGCTRCIGCIGLRNQDCCIFNRPVSKQEFETCWQQIFDGTRRSLNHFRNQFARFSAGIAQRSQYLINCENSTGQDLENCVNVKQSVNCFEARNLRYCLECYFDAADSYDVNNWGEQMEFCYELSGCGGQKGKAGLSHCMFGTYLFYGGYDLFYCINCVDVCQHLFGCA